MVAQLYVTGQAEPLCGSVPLPDDEDIAAARMALAAVCRGTSRIELTQPPTALLRTLLRAFEVLGIGAELHPGHANGFVIEVRGGGLDPVKRSPETLDLRGEPRAAGLLIGLLGGRSQPCELWVDPVVVELLGPYLVQAHGAEVSGEGGTAIHLPGRSGEARPDGAQLDSVGLYPWVKQAFLLQALHARSPSELHEVVASRDHLERALLRAKAPIHAAGTQVLVHPPRDLDALGPTNYQAMGSSEAAAALCSAAVVTPGSHVVVRDCGLNPTSSDWLGILRLLGAEVGVSPRGDRQGEPIGELSVTGALRDRPDRGEVVLAGETVARCGDSILPLLAPLGRLAQTTIVSDLLPVRNGAEPRVFSRAVGFLRAAGVDAKVDGSALVLRGPGAGRKLRPLEVTTGGDGRLAVLGTLLALAADGTSVIDDVECLRDHFPRWVGTLRALGAQVQVGEAPR